MKTVTIRTRVRTEMINITSEVEAIVRDARIDEGLCCVWVPHTTAGVTINENADPSVCRDILAEVNKIIPFDDGYAHAEGNSAAHIKASLFGSSVTVPVSGGRMALGTWQGIYFCEFDGPRSRSFTVTVR